MITLLLFIIFILLSIWKKDQRKLRNQEEKAKIVLILVIFYLIIYVLLGLKVGYERSPYSLKFIEILKNFITIFLVFVFYEIVRTKMIKNFNSFFSFFIISIFFFLIEIKYENFGNNILLSELFEYILGDLLNVLVESFLLSYLSKKGGYILNFSYTIPMKLTLILLPIFPNLNWFIWVSLRYILYLLIFLFIKQEEQGKGRKKSKREIRKETPIKLIPLIILIFLIASFVAGLFPIRPVAVVSNSMVPYFSRGDICIIQKIKEIEEGDVIEYQSNNIFILHRVIKKVESNDGYYYYTKGDNNTDQDLLPVKEEQVIGKVIYTIQYLGYPSVWFSEWLARKSR